MKYDVAGVLSVSEYSWWKTFFGGFQLNYGSLPQSNPPCLIKALSKTRKFTSAPLDFATIVPEKITAIHSEQMKKNNVKVYEW